MLHCQNSACHLHWCCSDRNSVCDPNPGHGLFYGGSEGAQFGSGSRLLQCLLIQGAVAQRAAAGPCLGMPSITVSTFYPGEIHPPSCFSVDVALVDTAKVLCCLLYLEATQQRKSSPLPEAMQMKLVAM